MGVLLLARRRADRHDRAGGGSPGEYCVATMDVDFTAVEVSPDVIALRDTFRIPPDRPPSDRVRRRRGVRAPRRSAARRVVDAFVRGSGPDALARRILTTAGVAAAVAPATDRTPWGDPAYGCRLGRRGRSTGVVVVDVPVTENDLVFAGTEPTFHRRSPARRAAARRSRAPDRH
jgi:spermidine synthase